VKGVTSANVAAINSAIHAQAGTNGTPGAGRSRRRRATAVDSAAKVQAIVNAYQDVLAAADAPHNNGAAALSQDDYTALGVTGTTAASAALMSVVIGQSQCRCEHGAKLQTLADAAKACFGYDDPVADAGAAPSAAQINSLIAGQSVGGIPVPTVTEDALVAVRAAISAANSDARPWPPRLRSPPWSKRRWTPTAAIDAIEAYAVNNSAAAPTDAQYAAAGVKGDERQRGRHQQRHPRPSGHQRSCGRYGRGRPTTPLAVDSAAKVQAIVNAYQDVLAAADATTPTTAQQR
jgi:hypothetical protein